MELPIILNNNDGQVSLTVCCVTNITSLILLKLIAFATNLTALSIFHTIFLKNNE